MKGMDDLDRKIQAVLPRYRTNDGHGHVWSRPDGMRYRCGGPGMCQKCSADQQALSAARQQVAGAVE